MKGLKKLALVTAVAAAPFAHADLVAMDDAVLADMTGQAGVSIELDTAVTIASMTYTDGDGLAVAKGGSATGGSVVMSNIAFGGAAVAGGAGDARFDEILIDIDVDAVGGVVVHLGGTNTPGVVDGTAPVDFGLSVGSVTASGVTNPLASNINIAGNLGPVDVTINNTTGSDLVTVAGYFEVTSGSMDIDVIGLGVRNLTVGQDSNPISTGSYGTAISNLVTTGASADSSGVDNMAYFALAIGNSNTGYFDTGTGAAVAVDNALDVTVASLNIDVSMDLTMGSVGGVAQTIGTIALDDLNMSGTNLKIFGH